MSTRIGIDIGGTFTDLVFYDEETNDILVDKIASNIANPDVACIEAVKETISPEKLADTRFFLHGTTVGLNALIERKGAKVGLLATKGFRDILEIRRYEKDNPYDLFFRRPVPLVPRRQRLSVSERINWEGNVLTPLNCDDVLRAYEVLKDVDAIAISFLHSYANAEHELAAAEVLRSAGFAGEIVLSHQVSGEAREYERTSSTVISAFVMRKMKKYLGDLETGLREQGFAGRFLISRSGGGSMTFSEAMERPFETINSGPVAGAERAALLARQLNCGDLITADIGGTSFDTCLVRNGTCQLMYEGSVDNLPVQGDWLDVRSIGAGGGSIIYRDEGGLLQVGPRSAGSTPGPACYGRGGTEPTTTDASLILGMFGDGRFSSEFQLDLEKARTALNPIANELGFTLEETARGVMTLAAAAMANTIQEITVERGLDPRKMKLLAFGGAGPLMGTLLADELSIKEIIVPRFAGNFSAYGLTGLDLVRGKSRTVLIPLSNEGLVEINACVEQLFGELEQRSECTESISETKRRVTLDMRYVGQEHALAIAVDYDERGISHNTDTLKKKFEQEYVQHYMDVMPLPVQVSSIRVYLQEELPKCIEKVSTGNDEIMDVKFRAYSFNAKKQLDFRIVNRVDLNVGQKLAGPAIIKEETTTTYLDAHYDAELHESGHLVLTVNGDRQ